MWSEPLAKVNATMGKRKSAETPVQTPIPVEDSKRRPGFRSVETRDHFEKLFGKNVKLPLKPGNISEAGLKITTHLTDDAASYLISTELAPFFESVYFEDPQRKSKVSGHIRSSQGFCQTGERLTDTGG